MKHEIEFGNNEVTLSGVWAWLFYINTAIWCIVGLLDIVWWFLL